MRKTVFSAIVCLLVLALSGCATAPRHASSFALDTICQVTVYGENDARYLDDTLALIDRQEAVLSRHASRSIVTQLNVDRQIQADSDFLALLFCAQEVSDLTGGAFDVMLGTMSDLWDFMGENPRVPEPTEIKAALSQSGMAHLQISGDTVSVLGEAQMDLGGIAKGWIADQAAQYLRAQGVSSAIVNLGGNVVLIGARPDGADFTVGIQKPFDVNGTILAQVKARDCAVVTGGVYQRSFVQDDTRYHHVLDPKTGMPAQTDLLSATVVCADAARADALSTAFLILGREQALALAQILDGVDVILVDEAMQVYYTPGLNGKVEVLP